MTFKLPDLPYAHDALQPDMSKETLEYHHDKHHQAYVTNGNNLLKGTEFENKSLEEIVKGSFGKNAPLFNNAGQHYNHLHFWSWMKPNGGGNKLPGRLEKKITEDLGGLEKFKTDFSRNPKAPAHWHAAPIDAPPIHPAPGRSGRRGQRETKSRRKSCPMTNPKIAPSQAVFRTIDESGYTGIVEGDVAAVGVGHADIHANAAGIGNCRVAATNGVGQDRCADAAGIHDSKGG